MSTVQGLDEDENMSAPTLEESVGETNSDEGKSSNDMLITMSSLFREKVPEFSEEEDEEEDDEDLELVLQQQFKNQASTAFGGDEDDDDNHEGRTNSTQSSDFIDAEKCIANDPWDLRAWFTLVEEAAIHDRGGTTTGIMALEKMITQFSMSSYVWNHYITHCMNKKKFKKTKELFDRCLFSPDEEGNNYMKTSEVLWLTYLRFTKVGTWMRRMLNANLFLLVSSFPPFFLSFFLSVPCKIYFYDAQPSCMACI